MKKLKLFILDNNFNTLSIMNLINPIIASNKKIPLDIWNIIKNYLYFEINDTNIKIAVGMWRENKNKALILYGNISYWDTSMVTDMSCLFSCFYYFNDNIKDWNVSNVKNMNYMFYSSPFNQDISNWNVSNVKNMCGMFAYAYKFNQPLNNWNVSNVENMGYMFKHANSFNQDINNWNICNVKNMKEMFFHAYKFNQPIGNWNVSNVKCVLHMFEGVDSFNKHSIKNQES